MALAMSPAAEASTRSFSFPAPGGVRLSACLNNGATCGKPVADAFCQQQGYSESILFAREAVSSARPLDGESLCEGASCQAFSRIKCYQPQAQVENTAAQ